MPVALLTEFEHMAVVAVLLVSLLMLVPPAPSASSCRRTSSAWCPASCPCVRHHYNVLVLLSVFQVRFCVMAVALAIVCGTGLVHSLEGARGFVRKFF